MDRDKLAVLYKKYQLAKEDIYQHKHYLIITRQGIDKIQAKEKIFIEYDAVKVDSEFCVVKAKAQKEDAKIETFGSAKYGSKTYNESTKKYDESGNTTTWYVMEMAEKKSHEQSSIKTNRLL
jgi:hypothetical protein